MFVKVSRWKVSGTNKFMTSSNFDEFRTCLMCVHFHLLVFEFDCLHPKKWKKMRIVSPFWMVSSFIWVFPKIGGKPLKWMVFYNGKPLFSSMDDFGGKTPLFSGKTSISLQPNFSQRKTCASARILWLMAATFQAFDQTLGCASLRQRGGSPKWTGF